MGKIIMTELKSVAIQNTQLFSRQKTPDVVAFKGISPAQPKNISPQQSLKALDAAGRATFALNNKVGFKGSEDSKQNLLNYATVRLGVEKLNPSTESEILKTDFHIASSIITNFNPENSLLYFQNIPIVKGILKKNKINIKTPEDALAQQFKAYNTVQENIEKLDGIKYEDSGYLQKYADPEDPQDSDIILDILKKRAANILSEDEFYTKPALIPLVYASIPKNKEKMSGDFPIFFMEKLIINEPLIKFRKGPDVIGSSYRKRRLKPL